MLEARSEPRAENGKACPYHCLNLTTLPSSAGASKTRAPMPTAALRAIPPSTATVDDNTTGHAAKCRRMYSHPVSVQHDTYPEMKLAGPS